MTTSSRQVFAFARDKGLPFHRFLSRVQSNGVPTNAVYLTLVFTCLIALIIIGSPTAFYIILSLSSTGLFTSYIVVRHDHSVYATSRKCGPHNTPKLSFMLEQHIGHLGRSCEASSWRGVSTAPLQLRTLRPTHQHSRHSVPPGWIRVPLLPDRT